MSKELKYLLQSLKCNDNNSRCMILKNIAALIQNANRNDLLCLLGVLNTTRDIELQVHMISLCCVYLLSNNENIDVFITNNYMYASIEKILSKNLPNKTTVVLNFLTLLLHADSEVFAAKKLCLGTHVRHMIRTTGCLATMTDFFVRGMMCQNTWRALCQCLAQSCCSCEINQSYCSHLIPKCVQVCIQGNPDAPPLLFSLLQNHERNIHMFIQTNGMCLFSRNLLQYTPYLQLLDTVIQTSPQAVIIASKSGILDEVHGILKSHGPFSQMGQWATVILYHADSIIKENKQINENIGMSVADETNKNDVEINHRTYCDNTTQLFHNIMKEIVQWQPTVNTAYRKSFNVANKTINYKETKDTIGNRQFKKCMNEDNVEYFNFQPKTKDSRRDDLNFSFLQQFKENSTHNEYNNFATKETTKKINSYNSLYDFKDKTDTGDMSRDAARRNILHVTNEQDDISILSIKHFKPVLMSTPKRRMHRSIDNTRESIDIVKNKERKTTNKLIYNKRHKSIVNKDLKNKSFSIRLFNAINNSCVSVVNKVKNIFTLNHVSSSDSKSAISNAKSNIERRDVCSYSFTKFMDERDARMIGNRNISNTICKSIISDVDNSCRTCDDTMELKQKLNDNKHLKYTIRKLTLGINIYGCDFKKISEVMWPQESYMTPKVLYNLYRKLIRK